jgi:hypothetical protein
MLSYRRLTLFLLTVAVSLIAPAAQPYIRYVQNAPEKLHPAFTLLACAQLLLLGLYALVEGIASRREQIAEEPSIAGEFLHRARPFLLAALAFGSIAWLLHESGRYLSTLWLNPAIPLKADMLALIDAGLREFWIYGDHPNRHFQVGHWDSWNTYLPGLWLPYSLPYLLGVDLRLWQVACFVMLISVLAFHTGWGIIRESSVAGIIGRIAAFVAFVFFFRSWTVQDFLPSAHVIGFWLTMAVWGVAVLHDKRRLAAFAFGLLIITRPHAVLIAPLYVLYTLRRNPLRESLLLMAMGFVPFILFMLPFLLVNYQGVVPGMVKAYDELHMYRNL